MTLLRELRLVVRETIDLLVNLPTHLTRWLRNRHQPLRMDDPDRTVLCDWCSNGWTGKAVPWPCDHYMRLDERLRELQRAPDA